MTALEFYIEGLKAKGFSNEKIKELTEHKDLPWLQFAEDYYTKQLTLTDVVNCVFVVTERDNYGEQLFKDVFENKEQAIEFLAKNGLWESNIHEINELNL